MRERRADLWAVALWAVLAAGLLQFDSLPRAVRLLAGLPLVLALPGYPMSHVLLPTRSLGTVERAVLSVALALTVTILGTLLLALLSITLSSRSWSLFLGGITGVACAVAGAARADPRTARRTWRAPRVRDAAAVAAAVAIASAAIVLARTPLDPPRGVTGYTQLWALPVAAGFELGVANRELRPVHYRLDLSANGRVMRRWPLSLSPGQRWTHVIAALSLNTSSNVVTARLYRADTAGPTYRFVRFRLSPPGSSSGARLSPGTP